MLNTIQEITRKIQKLDNTEVELIFEKSKLFSCNVRKNQIEHLETNNSNILGIRIISGKRQVFASTSNTSQTEIDSITNQLLSVVSQMPEDEHLELATEEQTKINQADSKYKKLELYDPSAISHNSLIDIAKTTEEIAISYPGITNSEGSCISHSKSDTYFISSYGININHQSSYYNLSSSLIAGKDDKMQQNYDSYCAVYFDDLIASKEFAQQLASDTVKKLNPKKIKSCILPVIFENKIASSLLSYIISATMGDKITKKTSFLTTEYGKKLMRDEINIVDDPHLNRGLSSCLFDDEGFRTSKKNIFHNGKLENWFLDLSTAKQLGLSTNFSASRGISSPCYPSSTNCYIENGKSNLNDIISDIKEGLFITSTFGMGVDLLTGTYSQGASGFMIENGKISYPVEEITVASNLKDIMSSLVPANDLKMLESSIASPSLFIPKMTIAGS